jgi:hypothetical protein
MKLFLEVCGGICGLWFLFIIPGVAWLAWLHHKGELVGDPPPGCEKDF